MTNPKPANMGKDLEADAKPAIQPQTTGSRGENERQDWPGKSEPGHIRPIGPARRVNENQPDSNDSANTRRSA